MIHMKELVDRENEHITEIDADFDFLQQSVLENP